jgi:hypothetical protein
MRCTGNQENGEADFIMQVKTLVTAIQSRDYETMPRSKRTEAIHYSQKLSQ